MAARRILRQAEELGDLVRAAGKPLSGGLRMGVIPTIAPFLLPRLLPELRTRFPDLKLFLRAETSQAACDRLHRGQLDCVLHAPPTAAARSKRNRCSTTGSTSPFPPGTEGTAAEVTPDAVDEGHLLLLEDGHCLKEHALAACNRPELRAEAAIMETSLHTLVQMVGNGLGQTLVPEMAVKAGILNGTGVVALPSRQPTPSGASPSSGAKGARGRRSSASSPRRC